MHETLVRRLIALLLGLASVACAAAPASSPSRVTTATPPAVVSTSTATTAPSSVPTATSPPAATASAGADYPEMPSANCCRGLGLDAGRYKFPGWFGIPMTVDVPDGWRVMNERAALLFLLGRGENAHLNPSQILLFLDATDRGTPQAIIDGIRQVPQLAEAGAPSEVTIAGFAGVQADLAALPNPDFEGIPADDIPPGVQYLPVIESYLAPGFAWTTSTPEARVRTIALTVGEQILLVYLEGPVAEFDDLTTSAAAILESLEPIAQ